MPGVGLCSALPWYVDISTLGSVSVSVSPSPDRYRSLYYSRNDASASHPRNPLDFGFAREKTQNLLENRSARFDEQRGGSVCDFSRVKTPKKCIFKQAARPAPVKRIKLGVSRGRILIVLLPELFSRLAKVTSFDSLVPYPFEQDGRRPFNSCVRFFSLSLPLARFSFLYFSFCTCTCPLLNVLFPAG